LLGTGTKNAVNTVIFATRGKKHRKYAGFVLPREKNIGIYGVFCSESFKKTWKHHLFGDFGPYKIEKEKLSTKMRQKDVW